MSKMSMKNCIELIQFRTLDDYVEYCDGVTKSNFKSGNMSSNDGSSEFSGTKDYGHASKLVREGWEGGVRRIEKVLNVIAEGKDIVAMEASCFDIIGVTPIVPAYLSGDPECMYNPVHTEDLPVVNVVMDISASAVLDKDRIVNRGAAILAFCSALEGNGQRVAIHASQVGVSHRGNWHACITQIKAAELDFNMHALSYAMVNASMLRRHGFRVIENLPKKHAEEFSSGYGRPANLIDVEGIRAAIGDVDLYIKGIGSAGNWDSIEAAVESVNSMAKEQGLIC